MTKKGKMAYKPAKYVECHHGNILAVTSPNGVSVYGAGTYRGMDANDHRIDLIISLIGSSSSPTMTGSAQTLMPKTSTWVKPTVVFDIRDGSVPNFSKEFWNSFASDIDALGKDKGVLIYCMGGHGRTGTFLSILQGIWFPNAGDPVKLIREAYCKKAVETSAQIKYIEQITGIPVKVGASKKAAPYAAYGNVGWGGDNSYIGIGTWHASEEDALNTDDTVSGPCAICGKEGPGNAMKMEDKDVVICDVCYKQTVLDGKVIVRDGKGYFNPANSDEVLVEPVGNTCEVCGKPGTDAIAFVTAAGKYTIVRLCRKHAVDAEISEGIQINGIPLEIAT